MAELMISLCFALMTMHYWTRHRYSGSDAASDPSERGLSRTRAVHALIIFFTAIMLSAGTTWALYSSPENHKRIDKRIMNGVEKFAGRYSRYGQWETAADLYYRVHVEKPGRNSIMRKLARCYKKLGDNEKFSYYNNRVLEKDLKKFAKSPDKISLNHSMVRTYRQRGELEKADEHMKRALDSALARVKRRPESASSAYWLGKTYQLMGEKGKALKEYERACKLKPSSTKYRKAFYRAAASAD